MAKEPVRPIRYRLGLDLGSTSIGWAVLRLNERNEPDYLVRSGVRIFSDGRKRTDGTSLAVDRRLKRQQRRRRDRLLRRKRRLIAALTHAGLWPESRPEQLRLKNLNPYELRARGLREALTPYELGRAIFHLNQRRGFRSNRRTDRGQDKEKGLIRSAISALTQKLRESEAETLGQYLYERWRQGEGTRARPLGQGANVAYEFYVDRALVAAEFDLLWERQRQFNAIQLTDTAREKIRDVLFYQRPLKPAQAGRCSLEPDEPRALIALPSTQRFRILQEVNHLRVRATNAADERPLTVAERTVLLEDLFRGKSRTFDEIRRRLKLPHARFNLESERRKKLNGDLTAVILAKPSCFGKVWHQLPLEEQDATVSQLLDDSLTDEEVARRLRNSHGLSPDSVERILTANLPDGYARLSYKAIKRILPFLYEGLTYDKAVRAAGYSTTDTSMDGSAPELPYYGRVLERHVAFGTGNPRDPDEKRFGRVANPTVHITLNQLRRLVNALIARYGKPAEVVLELARDLKLGRQRAREIEREQAERQRDNDRLREELQQLGQPVNAENMLRLRLYRELERATGITTQCVYTGEQISLSQLFTPEVEVDHILPYSRTLDDSIANKVLCKARANALKGNRTPYEAFGHSPEGYVWQEILLRAAALPRNRRWRFSEDAMLRYEENGAFLARQLTDTAYMSRLAREYMTAICPSNKVWVTPGTLTGLLRSKWGLNRLLAHDDQKNRLDHRHHAIDAVVIACVDRSLVQKVAAAAARAEGQGSGRLLDGLEHPWPSFMLGVENAIRRMVVSHRPDHNPQDALHNDTSYGCRDTEESDATVVKTRCVHHYVPLLSLADAKPTDIREHLADERHGRAIAELLERRGGTKADARAALEEYGRSTGIRRLRWVEQLTVIPIRDRRTGVPYKFVKGDGNYCYEIYETPAGQWAGELISTFTANQRDFLERMQDMERYRRETFSGKPLVMRLIVNDTVAIELDGRRLIYRVQKMSEGRIVLAYHAAAGDPTRNGVHIPEIPEGRTVITVSPGRLQQLNARRVFVDMLGRVLDPGRRHAGTHRRASGG